MNERNKYLIGATLIWVVIWLTTGAALGTHEFDDMIPILGGGTVYFLVLVPALHFRKRA